MLVVAHAAGDYLNLDLDLDEEGKERKVLGLRLRMAKAREPIVYKRYPNRRYKGIFVRFEDLIVIAKGPLM
jgi:hypothetical protein